MPGGAASYHFTLFALPNLVAAALILGWGAWVRWFEGPTRIGNLTAALSLAAATWLGGFGLVYTATSAAAARPWIELTQFGVLALPPLLHALLARLFQLQGWRRRINPALWLVSLALAAALVTHTDYFRAPYHYWWGYYAHYGIAGTLSAVYLAAMLAWLAVEGARVLRALPPESTARRRVKLILVGFTVAFGGIVDILPAWGVPCYPFGYAMVMVLIGTVGYAAWRYRLLSITPETAAQQILASLTDGVGVVDEAGRVALINARAEELLGVRAGELLGRPAWELAQRLGIADQVEERILREPAGEAREVRLPRPGGGERVLSISGWPLRSRHGETLLEVWVLHDVTDYRRAAEEIEYLAYHDRLTGLPNRALLLDRLGQALARLNRPAAPGVCLVLLGLDRFTNVNDSFGHSAGDRVLRVIAERLAATLRPGDTLARVGADEFGVLLEGEVDPASVQALVAALQAELQQEIVLQGEVLTMHASVGVSLARAPGRDPEGLLREADTAMHQAKRGHGPAPVFFQSEMNVQVQTRLELEQGLRRAIQRDELEVYYQPLVAVADGHVAGFEAVVRWNHPRRGMLQPDEFIPVAEDTGLITRLDGWVVATAARQVARWHALLGASDGPSLSVNLSPRKLRAGGVADELAAVLREARLPPRSLTVEITESALMEDTDTAFAELSAIRELGVRLSIDDFGTGYSSLAYLKRFPVTETKIDRSFVAGLGRDPNDTAIVRAVIALSHALGLETVAEGVENELQLEILGELGCELAQGFLFGPPLPADKARALLDRRPRRSGSAGAG
ncbi:MAG TPA: EAL domain-containing protein [Gammaproteobacteria bacterium]|nr:EAL domain-containing protein [Gammaproteobacteria bacterium]